jgi:hypothetical protein
MLSASPRTFRGSLPILAALIAYVNLAALLVPAMAATGSGSPLGINLSGFQYWTTNPPFKNVMGQQGWGWNLSGAPSGTTVTQYTSDGVPLVWDTAYSAFKFIFIHGPGKYPPGPWVLLYDGVGDFTFGWDAKSAVKTAEGRYTFTTPVLKDGITLTLRRTNRSNPVHNLRMVEQKYEADYQTDPWYPELTDLCKEFSTLRFMDWMGASSAIDAAVSDPGWGAPYLGWTAATASTVTLDTVAVRTDGAYVGMLLAGNGLDGWRPITAYNGATRTATITPPYTTVPTQKGYYTVKDFPNREWADRALQTDLAQNTEKGMAVEWLVDLCNRTNCSPWFSLPTAASDDFLRQYATYVRDHLNRNLRIYIEWSNEAWNWSGYPGWDWSDAYGRIIGIGGFSAYPAYRMVQMFKIWDDVFGEAHLRSARTTSRLQRVLSVQGGYTSRAQALLDFDGTGITGGYPNPIDAGHKACDYADVVAVTNYIAEGVDDVKKFATTLTVDQMVDSLKREIDARCASTGQNGSNYWYLDVAMAEQRGLNAVTYESGVSLYNNPFDSLTGVKLDALEVSPRMKELYLYCLNKWKALGVDGSGKGAALWNQFGDTGWNLGNSGQWGHWSIREYSTESIDSCPKWQALREFAQNNARWWTDVPLPTGVASRAVDKSAQPFGAAVSAAKGTAAIRYVVPSGVGKVTVSIGRLDGSLVKTLVNGPIAGGSHTVVWDGRNSSSGIVPSGVYLCRVTAGDRALTAKLMFAR